MAKRKHNAGLLAAGVILQPGEKTPKDVPIDKVTARAYRHAGLGDRTVVKLVPEKLAPAADLEMEILGFGKPQNRGVVGKQRRRALGFPGWALVHDPKHARYALAVVEEFKKEARRAKTKPGHAKTGIDAIADKLGASVPGFLPSFYEEAGRVFIAAGNFKYAGQAFGKAREAERVHALEVDEEQRREAFLEFALAGAVPVKVLTGYAKELEKNLAPDEAYDHFRQLCLRRTLGGMPPWAGMAKDLKRLAKGAGLDPKEEESKFLSEIAETPALGKAPWEFWKTYSTALVALCKKEPSVQGALLNLFPDPSPAKEGFDAYWLNLLEKCHALAALRAKSGKTPLEAAPNGSPAAWFGRLVKHVGRGWQGWTPPTEMFDLLREMKKRLVADDIPVSLASKWGKTDLDLLDFALELGIPVADPEKNLRFDLGEWAKWADEPERGRDPVNVAGDERFTRALDVALDSVMGAEPFNTVSRQKKGLAAAKQAWLKRWVDTLETAALPLIHQAIGKLNDATDARLFQEFPDAHARLEKVAVGPALARTLRGGLIDELGWPALDEAAAELKAKGQQPPKVHGAFPYIAVSDGVRVLVVSPEGRVLEHDLQLPKGAELLGVRYSQQQILVIFHGKGSYAWKGYWSGQPTEVFELPRAYGLQEAGKTAYELTDGSMVEGGGTLSAGDRDTPQTGTFLSDGETFWRPEWASDKYRLREFDPRTSEKGRFSLPTFLEEFAEEDTTVDVQTSRLMPLPRSLESSPLGSKEGMTGLRRRHAISRDGERPARGRTQLETIDGMRWEGNLGRTQVSHLVRFPGDDRPRPLTYSQWSWRSGDGCPMYDPDGKYQTMTLGGEKRTYCKGTIALLPPNCWHAYAPRDLAGSQALRQLTDKTAGTLLEQASKELENDAEDADPDKLVETAKKLTELLPEITHPALVRGVVGVIGEAARLRRGFERMCSERDPKSADERPESTVIDDGAVGAALRSVISRAYYGAAGTPLDQDILAVSRFFTRDDRRPGDGIQAGNAATTWPTLVGRMGAAAFIGASLGTIDDHRAALADLLELWADTPLSEPEGKLRVMYVDVEKLPHPAGTTPAINAFDYEGNAYWSKQLWWGHRHRSHQLVLEYARDGKWRDLPGSTIAEVHHPTASWGSPDQLRQTAKLLRDKNAVPWDPAIAETIIARTGLTRSEATLLWIALPNVDAWEANFLSKEIREAVGLKATEAKAARTTLKGVHHENRLALYHETMPDDPAELWRPLGDGPDDDESPVARLCAKWVDLYGKRIPLPDELLISASKEVSAPLSPTEILCAFSSPESSELLTSDGSFDFGQNGAVVPKSEGEEPPTVFTAEVAGSVASYLPYLFVSLPVGDPLRNKIPQVLELCRARLASEELLIPLGTQWFWGDEGAQKREELLDALGGDPLEGGVEGRDSGQTLAVVRNDSVHAAYRPAKNLTAEEWNRLEKLDFSFRSSLVKSGPRYLLSEGFTRLSERTVETPVPEGEWEMNPLHSVPDLVMKVVEKHGLTEDAAVLYLQTLALWGPTKKNVQRWNGWKPARYNKAAKVLTAKELLLEAKRARAGRGHFIPGGWAPLKTPHLPIETWKIQLYEATQDAEGFLVFPLERFLPLRPVHEIFEAAWARVEAGDVPAYEEVG